MNGKGDELEVDKAWHGLHFLLTGSAWEGSFSWIPVVAGGSEVGDNLGYGPRWSLTSANVGQSTPRSSRSRARKASSSNGSTPSG